MIDLVIRVRVSTSSPVKFQIALVTKPYFRERPYLLSLYAMFLFHFSFFVSDRKSEIHVPTKTIRLQREQLINNDGWGYKKDQEIQKGSNKTR